MINILHGDCMDLMKDKPDNYWDLLISDPPYGIGIDGQKEQLNNKNKKHNRKGHDKKGWDSLPDENYFLESIRVSKNQIFWGANYYPQYLTKSKGWVVWYKGQEGLTMSDCELAYSSFDTPTRVVKINRVQLLIESNTNHPTIKPIKLYKWLLKNYAKEGDKILDTHGGSMSSAIACHDMKFDLDIIELDKDYYDAGKKRFDNHIKQLTLF